MMTLAFAAEVLPSYEKCLLFSSNALLHIHFDHLLNLRRAARTLSVRKVIYRYEFGEPKHGNDSAGEILVQSLSR